MNWPYCVNLFQTATGTCAISCYFCGVNLVKEQRLWGWKVWYSISQRWETKAIHPIPDAIKCLCGDNKFYYFHGVGDCCYWLWKHCTQQIKFWDLETEWWAKTKYDNGWNKHIKSSFNHCIKTIQKILFAMNILWENFQLFKICLIIWEL